MLFEDRFSGWLSLAVMYVSHYGGTMLDPEPDVPFKTLDKE